MAGDAAHQVGGLAQFEAVTHEIGRRAALAMADENRGPWHVRFRWVGWRAEVARSRALARRERPGG